MKRFVCLLLIVMLLVCAVGCNKGESAEPKSPVGTWEYTAGKTVLVLHEGNSGELSENGKIYTVIWSYDKASHLLLITRMDTGYTYEATYLEESDIIVSDGRTYQRASATVDPESEPSQNQNASGIDFSHFYGHWVFMDSKDYDGENGPPCTSVTINADHTCLIDGVPGTWDGHADCQIWLIKEGGMQIYLYRSEYNDKVEYLLFENGGNQFRGWVNMTTSEQILITAENWKDYFELVTTETYKKNAFGEVTTFEIWQKLLLKEEFADRVVYEDDIAVEYTCMQHRYYVTIDKINETYTLGELIEEIEDDPEIRSLDYYGGDDIWYIQLPGGCYISIDQYEAPSPGMDDNTVIIVTDIEDIEFLRVKGSIYVSKP